MRPQSSLRASPNPPQPSRFRAPIPPRPRTPLKAACQLCLAQNLPQAYSHSISQCFKISPSERALIRSGDATNVEEEDSQASSVNEYVEDEQTEDLEEYDDESTFYARSLIANKSYPAYNVSQFKDSRLLPLNHLGQILIKRSTFMTVLFWQHLTPLTTPYTLF